MALTELKRARLASAEWTVVEQFERDGEQFIVARRKALPIYAREVLSAREREALWLLALGNTNKEIAFELGIAHSTVGVLLWRAASKLGIRSRRELIAAANDIGEP